MEERNSTQGPAFDGRELQNLQEQLAGLAGCMVTCFDAKVQQVTTPSNPSAFYTLMEQEPVYAASTAATVRAICKKCLESNMPAFRHWPEFGASIACVPARLGKTTYGYWLLGPVRTSENVPPAAGVLGSLAPVLAEAIQEIPLVGMQRLHNMAMFVYSHSTGLLRGWLKALHAEANCKGLTEENRQLESTVQMLRQCLEESEAGICISDLETGEVLMANSCFARFTGMPLQKIYKSTSMEIARICFEVQKAGLFCPQAGEAIAKNGSPRPSVTWQSYTNAGKRYIRSTSRAIRWIDGRYVHMNTIVDITQERDMQRLLESLAYFDGLMNLPNQHRLEQDLKLRRAANRIHTTLLCFDTIALRRVNNAYSRAAGDALLCAVGSWLSAQNYGRLYHCGSDTFVVRLHDAEVEFAKRAAEKIVKRFALPWVLQVNGQEIEVSCGVWLSIIDGAALFEGLTGSGMVDLVECSLDIARRKKRLVVYNRQEADEQQSQNQQELLLRSCVNGGMRGFSVVYQPVVNPATNIWVGLEALCRWEGAGNGPVPPEEFIRMAEQMGLVYQIGEWVMDTAVAFCKGLGLDKLPDFHLGVNVSPLQLRYSQFAGCVAAILMRHSFPGEKLYLEITESSEFVFNAESSHTLAGLRENGIGLVIDDFGTGYSSFKNLRNLPVNLVKTEREFIQNIEEDSYLQFFFNTILGLTHAAGMQLVAEGIETQGQLDLVRDSGVDYVQGFLFGKPMPPPQVAANQGRFYPPGWAAGLARIGSA